MFMFTLPSARHGAAINWRYIALETVGAGKRQTRLARLGAKKQGGTRQCRKTKEWHPPVPQNQRVAPASVTKE
jgi:hypothetical protein